MRGLISVESPQQRGVERWVRASASCCSTTETHAGLMKEAAALVARHCKQHWRRATDGWMIDRQTFAAALCQGLLAACFDRQTTAKQKDGEWERECKYDVRGFF